MAEVYLPGNITKGSVATRGVKNFRNGNLQSYWGDKWTFAFYGPDPMIDNEAIDLVNVYECYKVNRISRGEIQTIFFFNLQIIVAWYYKIKITTIHHVVY